MLNQPRYVVAVKDLAASTAYYRDVLGFTVKWQELEGWRLFARNACLIMAGECKDAPRAADLGDHAYFAYVQVERIDTLHDEYRGNGAKITKALTTEAWGMREFGVETVDGHFMMFGEDVDS